MKQDIRKRHHWLLEIRTFSKISKILTTFWHEETEAAETPKSTEDLWKLLHDAGTTDLPGLAQIMIFS